VFQIPLINRLLTQARSTELQAKIERFRNRQQNVLAGLRRKAPTVRGQAETLPPVVGETSWLSVAVCSRCAPMWPRGLTARTFTSTAWNGGAANQPIRATALTP